LVVFDAGVIPDRVKERLNVKARKDLELLRDRLSLLDVPYVMSVVMFGSRARGESGERSDVDLLVLLENCEVEDPVARRRLLYMLIRKALGGEFEGLTVVDVELERFLKPEEVSPLLLNVYWDGVVVYDKTGSLCDFLQEARERIVKSGLKRVKDREAYFWMLPKPMKEVKIL